MPYKLRCFKAFQTREAIAAYSIAFLIERCFRRPVPFWLNPHSPARVEQLTGLYLKGNHLCPHGLSQSIDTDQVDAGFGVAANIIDIDVSGYFDSN